MKEFLIAALETRAAFVCVFFFFPAVFALCGEMSDSGISVHVYARLHHRQIWVFDTACSVFLDASSSGHTLCVPFRGNVLCASRALWWCIL